MSKPDQNDRNAETKPKHENAGVKTPRSRLMDLLINAFGLLAIVSGGVLGVVGIFGHWKNKETVAIWALYFTIVFGLTAFFFFWQKRIWESTPAQAAQPTQAEPRPRPMLTVESAALRKTEDGGAFVEIRVVNSGQGVGQNATVHTSVYGMTAVDGETLRNCPPPPDVPREAFYSVGVFGIGERRISGLGITFSKEEMADVEQGRARIFVHLLARYEGFESKGSYELEYYAAYEPVRRVFFDCPEHNRVT